MTPPGETPRDAVALLAGYDVAEAGRRGVLVCNVPASATEEVAAVHGLARTLGVLREPPRGWSPRCSAPRSCCWVSISRSS